MDLGLKDKTVLVTAASRGLGRAIAAGFAAEGANVVICSRGDVEIVKVAEEMAEETGGRVVGRAADVRDRNALSSLIDDTVSEFGGLDVVVANAAGPPPGDLFDLSEEDWHDAVDLTLMSAVHLAYLTVPLLRQREWGRWIAITSMTAHTPLPGLALSNALRPAVVALTRSLAAELAGSRVTANCVSPGWTRTERVVELMEERATAEGVTTAEAEQSLTERIPVGRLANPAEIAAAVVFLGSAPASYITGQTLLADGGFVPAS